MLNSHVSALLIIEYCDLYCEQIPFQHTVALNNMTIYVS